MVSSLDLYYLVVDLQPFVGSRIGKIYAPIWNEFYLELQKKDTGKQFLYVQVGESLSVVDVKEKVDAPSPFVMFLRKYISQGFIKAIYQHEFERICVLVIQSKGVVYNLVLEFFSKGNLILCDEKFVVMQCLHHQQFRDRTIKPHEPYQFPDPPRVVPFNLALAEFETMITMSTKENLVKTLALDFSFGGAYAEYICAQADVNKNLTSVSSTEIERLYNVILSFVDVRPEITRMQSVVADKKEDAWKQLIAKWERRVAKQEAYVAELEQTAVLAQRRGDILYAHYTDVEQAILSRTPTISLEGVEFRLDPNRSVSWHASQYYAQAKKAKRKVDTARAVTAASRAKLTEISAAPPEPKQKPVKRVRAWYEKFHWFYSSGGFLVVGGRDAATNDVVMHKHRRHDDLVFHTEAPGSPFFVVQTDGREVDSGTIAEAAQAAASYSQQWKAGKKQAYVFYATGAQCSKQKGDAVGTFHISGDRTQVKVALQIAIGTSDIVIGGPVGAISSVTRDFVVLVPGGLKKGELAKKIAQRLGVSAEHVLRFIPSGFAKIQN